MTQRHNLKSLEAFKKVELNGSDILSQISLDIRGENNRQPRPSDVRVLLRTADLQGQEYQFPNHGHPDNELSTVAFNGDNAIVIMPAGDTTRRQLFSAQQIIDRLKKSGLERATPDFIEKEIVRGDLSRKFVAQAYGPAPFVAQAARFVDVEIPSPNGGTETIIPDITQDYAVGMRAPTHEEAFLVMYSGSPKDLFMRAGSAAAHYLSTIENAVPATLRGTSTVAEHLDGIGQVTKGIVLSVDAATGGTKPIRLESAKDIFNIEKLPVVMVNDNQQVIAQYKPVFKP
ncbi:MAG: hypothetical protein JWO78_2087 [Micavibrio sp.]|nr:hypothetical protein [Micavibrio sp.]